MPRGFTIIELVTTVAILAGLASMLVAVNASSRDLIKLETAARQVRSILSETQAKGSSGMEYVPNGTTDTTSARFDKGYGVYLAQGSNQVIVYGGRGTTPAASTDAYSAATPNVVETSTLPSGVTVTGLSNGLSASIHFRRGVNKVYIWDSAGASGARLDITLSIGSGSQLQSKTVTVQENGLIYVN